MLKSLLYLPILGTLLLMFSCQKLDIASPQTEAIITAYDFAYCPCCGGLMITTNDNPNPYEAEYYLWSNPSDFPELSMDSFPIYIKMDFEIDSTRCVDIKPWINILDLEVID